MNNIKNDYNYKTELCKFYIDYNKCNKGDKCTYAHGQHELRSINNVPNKTCFYYEKGFCRNGNNCKFRHIKDNKENIEYNIESKDDLKIMLDNKYNEYSIFLNTNIKGENWAELTEEDEKLRNEIIELEEKYKSLKEKSINDETNNDNTIDNSIENNGKEYFEIP